MNTLPPHTGHRGRLKERFVKDGAESFDDVTLLELLLSYAHPRHDTRPLATELIATYGSLEGVLNAPLADLEREKGIRRHTAILIAMSGELFRRSVCKSADEALDFTDETAVSSFLVSCFSDCKSEICILLCLDKASRLVKKTVIHRGDFNSVNFEIRNITETAFNCGCSRVVLAHNHPSGSALPSGDDLLSTSRIGASLRSNGIELCQHYIVAGTRVEKIIGQK